MGTGGKFFRVAVFVPSAFFADRFYVELKICERRIFCEFFHTDQSIGSFAVTQTRRGECRHFQSHFEAVNVPQLNLTEYIF